MGGSKACHVIFQNHILPKRPGMQQKTDLSNNISHDTPNGAFMIRALYLSVLDIGGKYALSVSFPQHITGHCWSTGID